MRNLCYFDEESHMTRYVLPLAACCLAVCLVGCITIQDADGKGSRKLITPLLTVVGTRTDEKGEARTVTIIPLATSRRRLTRPDGVVTERTTVVPLLAFWERRTDATGYEKKEVFIAPLLFWYTKETGLETVEGETVPGEVGSTQDMQSVVVLSGLHRKSERGVVSSWGYVNLLLGFSRSGDKRTVRLFHLIPLPFLSARGKIPYPD